MLVGSALLFVAACESHEVVLAVPTTGVTVTPNESALHALSTARCEHAAACGRIGAGQQFATEPVCRAAANLDERSSIGLDACPFGVETSDLDRCVQAVRAQPCADAMRTLASVRQCHRMIMCR